MSRMSYQTLRLWTAFVKCLPCQCLAFYLGTSGSNSQIVKWSFYAMVFSVGGDFCLVFPDHFITGILLFALAQIMILWQTDIRQAAECGWGWLGTERHVMDVLSSNGLSP